MTALPPPRIADASLCVVPKCTRKPVGVYCAECAASVAAWIARLKGAK